VETLQLGLDGEVIDITKRDEQLSNINSLPPSFINKETGINKKPNLLVEKRAYNKSFRTVRDDSMVRTLHVGKTIKSSPVPPLFVSMKSTPNGTGYFNFPLDRIALRDDEDLQETIQEFLDIYFSGDSEDWLYCQIEPYDEVEDLEKVLYNAKVGITYEPGKLKPRVFAMINSVLQSLLAPLHDDLMSILRSIDEDCTHDQDKVTDYALQ
jgi:hypothetical protein